MLKNKRFVSLMVSAAVFVSSLGSLGVAAYAADENADGGEESWNVEYKSNGRQTPFRPGDGYVSKQNPPDFQWPYVVEAKKYDLIVCSDPELKDIKYSKYGLEKNIYSFPETFDTGVHYYWAMRWSDGSKNSEWSNPRRFRVDPEAYEFVYPGAEAVAQRIPKGHPRIYATPDTLEEVRGWKDTNEKSQAVYTNIINTAKAYVENGIILSEPVRKLSENAVQQAIYDQELLGDGGTMCKTVIGCALAYMLTGDKEIGRFGVKCLVEMSKWDINGDTSYQTQDQLARRIAFEGAIGYDLLNDLISESEKKQILDMIVARTKVMEYLLTKLEKSVYDSHGWTAYGYIGIIAVALYGDVPEAEDWFKTVLDGYTTILPPWSYQDGGWSQGPAYWQWSADSNKELMEILALGNLIDLNQKAWSKNEYLWMLYVYPPGSWGSFGDAGGQDKSDSYSEPVSVAARQLAFDRENKTLKWLINGWGGTNALGSGFKAYYSAAKTYDVEPEAPTAYPLAHEFEDIGWVVMTNDLVDRNRIQCTFKSSHFGSFNHSHADQNSFYIQAYGEKLAVKSGYYDAYHSKHDSGFTRKTGAHNSVTIATNKGQKDDDFTAKGQLTGFLTQVDFDMVSGDATPAYKGQLDKFERCMLYIRPDVFVVIDELDAKDESKESFEWWLNAESDIKTYDDGTGARLQQGAAVLDAKFQYPRKVTTYYNDTFALSDMKEYLAEGNFKDSNVQKRVWFETEKTDRTKMVVTMDVHKEQDSARYIDTEYYDDYTKMTFEDGTVVLVNLKNPGTLITTKEGITFDGTAVVYNDNSIMLALGTVLKWGSKTLIQCEDRASVVMGNDELSISSYTDQKISIDTENDYVSGIENVSNYSGYEISEAYGISMEKGMLKIDTESDEPDKRDNSEQKEAVVDSQAEGVTFTLDRDNYMLMLNGKKIEPELTQGVLRVKIEGEDTKEYTLDGYTLRDGTKSLSGKIVLDGKKYIVKSVSQGLYFGGLAPGAIKSLKEISVSTDKTDNEIVLEKVTTNELKVNVTGEHENVKNSATVFVEAEDAVLMESGQVYNTRQFLSGGAGVTKHDKEGTMLEYNITVPEDGDYGIALKYVAWLEGGALRDVSIDGKVYQILLPQTVSWGADPNDWVAAVTENTIHLKAGTYSMYIEAASGSWNLDWIALTKK